MLINAIYTDFVTGSFYHDFMRFSLPKYQITARFLRTGALFIGYTQEHSTTSTSIFIYRLLTNLKQYGVKPSEIHIQTDNGTEFTAPWNSLKKTLFTKIIELSFCSTHKTIPVGTKTFQTMFKFFCCTSEIKEFKLASSIRISGGTGDVESSHRLIEDEFYACRYFPGAQDFLQKAHEYQKHFNFTRFNTYKKGTPAHLLKQAAPDIKTDVFNFQPLIVDFSLNSYKNEFRLLAS